MPPKVLVHLGPAKTATTSLQSFLETERLSSLGIGLVEPFMFKGWHHELAKLLGASVPSGLCGPRTLTTDEESVVGLIRDSVADSEFDVNVISSEFLAEVPPDRLRDVFACISSDTTFVLAVRNPLAHALSFWAETIRGGSEIGLRAFLENPKMFLDWWKSVYLGSSATHGSRLSFISISESSPVVDLVSALFGSEALPLLEGLDPRQNISNSPVACDVHAMLNGALTETPTRAGWREHYLWQVLHKESAGDDRIIPAEWITSFSNEWDSSIDASNYPELSDCLTKVSKNSGRFAAVTEDNFVSSRQRIIEGVVISQTRTNALAHLEIDRLTHLINSKTSVDRTSSGGTAISKLRGPIVVVGDSHSLALERASDLLDPSERELIGFSERVNDAAVYWNAIERLGSDCELLCVSWRGNEHNVLSILPEEQFHVHQVLDSTISGNRHESPMVPISQLKAAFKRELVPLSELLSRSKGIQRLVILGPPPPKMRATVLKHLSTDAFYGKRMDLRQSIEDVCKLLPDKLRLLLWELQNDEYRQLSATLGAQFIGAPRDAGSKLGFLKSMFASNDCTHANERYGLLVLKEVIRVYRAGGAVV